MGICREDKTFLKLLKNFPCPTIEQIRKQYLGKESLLLHFERGRFGDDRGAFPMKLLKALQRYPSLLVCLEKISLRLDLINWNDIKKKLSVLAELAGYKGKLFIVLFFSGFDSAQSAYANCIFYGIEWYCPPDELGVPAEDPLYSYMKRLSRNPQEDISKSNLHEFTHIISKKVEPKKVNDLAVQLLEEGRACLISHLLEPKRTLSDILYYTSKEVEWCQQNETALMADLKKRLSKNDSKLKIRYFSPSATPLYNGGPRRLGYYLGYRLCRIAAENFSDTKKKIEYLLTLDNIAVVFKLLDRHIPKH